SWLLGRGNATSQQVYRDLEYLTVSGLEAEDRVSLQVVDLARADQTLLLPLWAGIPDAQRAAELVQATILDPERFWRPYGLPACLSEGQHTEQACQGMHLPWNALLIAGLLRYGYAQEAVELFTSNMNAVVENLTGRKACYHHYDVETGTGLGERHALVGLPPLGLYLRLLGVQLISARRVIIQGLNPFPNPVILRYRGLTIVCERERTRITFQGGQTAVVNTPDPRLVTLENEN
ncbi:MAG: hypothetical protein JW862_00980, partial [Anaerolineales bacterium]|nr:hypothetical protein [Anaerolineales bacterium]